MPNASGAAEGGHEATDFAAVLNTGTALAGLRAESERIADDEEEVAATLFSGPEDGLVGEVLAGTGLGGDEVDLVGVCALSPIMEAVETADDPTSAEVVDLTGGTFG